jgi:hypothetical protein
MPDPLLVVPDLVASGRWGDRRLEGHGTLLLYVEEGFLDDASGEQLVLAYGTLTDATWERETLTFHRASDQLSLRGPRELSRAWGLVVEQACMLPEVARGLRMLGTARGGSSAMQARFFGPLLSARRRLQDPDAMERRVAQFDAAGLSRRLSAAVVEFATERHPADAPRRRALEAHLEEALEPLQHQLAALAEATEAIRGAGSGSRFVAWRVWTRLLRRVFLEADRAWGHMVRHLEPR